MTNSFHFQRMKWQAIALLLVYSVGGSHLLDLQDIPVTGTELQRSKTMLE